MNLSGYGVCGDREGGRGVGLGEEKRGGVEG